MNEPVRWRDDPGAPAELRALLGAARVSRRMTAAEFRRGSRRVTAATAAVAGLWLWVKSPAFAALIGAAGGVIVATGAPLLFEQPTESRSVTASAPAAVAPPAVRTPAPTIGVPPPRPPPVASSGVRPAVAPRPSSEPEPAPRDTLADEARMIEQARQVLGADPKRSLELLEQHRELFARGKLGMERELLMVDALRRTGKIGEARSRARALQAQPQQGIYATRLKQLLAELE
jgi:hypothetical protein